MTPEKQAWIAKQFTENTPLNQLRMIFSSEMGRIEQAGMQRVALTGLELKEMEFAAVTRLISAIDEADIIPI